MMTPAMREDLAGREQDIQRGKTVELLRRAGKEMYENPIVNTAIGFTPGVGDVQAAGETFAALQRGAPWQETAGYAVGMLPFVPALRTTWHGSPHGFTKFDMSKIGTGEGAQAYGHGLYLAEARPVAEEYKQALSNPEVVLKSGERISNPAVGSNEDVAKAWLEEQFLKGSATPFDDAIARLNKLKGAANNPQQFEGAAEVLNQWKNEGATVDLGGYLYKVDLPDEQIAKMLDWDKPLSEQPQAVQDALHQAALVNFETNIGPKASGEIGDLGWTKNVKSMSGEDLYRKLTEGAFTNEMFLQGTKKGEAQAVISDKLRQAGIPGIQYLDQASRGAGEGTRNYVVFSDEIPQILERNGQPVAQALREYEPNYLYHGTGEGAFRKIIEQGLNPVGGKGYLANTEDYAKTYAQRKGAPFGERILRTKQTPEFIEDVSNQGGDFVFNQNIPTNALELKVNDKWIPLNEYYDESINIMPRNK